VLGVLAVAVVLVRARRKCVELWRYAATALAYTLGVVCVLLAYPLIFTFTGSGHINGPPQSSSFLATLNGDLLSPFLASSRQWLDPAVIGQKGIPAGNLLYLGLPMVVVLACFAIFLRSRKEILFAGVLALMAFVLSLGSPLTINGHRTPVPLPFAFFAHLPALSGFEARRFALYTDLFAAAMFAIGVDELCKRMRKQQLLRRSPAWNKAIGSIALGTLILVVAVPLVPSSTQASDATNIPAFFTSTAVDSIPPGSVVLAYPYPDFVSENVWSALIRPVDNVLLDQAVAGMRFNLIGGFGWFPLPSGRGGTSYPAQLQPQLVQALFDSDYWGVWVAPRQRALLLKSNITKDLRTFLLKYNVQTVLVVQPGPSRLLDLDVQLHLNPAGVISHVTAALGPPNQTGRVTAWFHVGQRLASP
jgi:hypothetical protein